MRALALDDAGYPAAWVKHYVAGDAYRGLVRTYDSPGVPDGDDLRRLALYPDPVEPLLGENQNEIADDIVAAFHYPWYGNPATSGNWGNWAPNDHDPPSTSTFCAGRIGRWRARGWTSPSFVGGDDSASVSPGFWFIHEDPRLARDLDAFRQAWDRTVAEARQSRFLLIETWNGWPEGTSIEPGQRILRDDENGFSPTGDDYSYDYIDAMAEKANVLRWTTPGHRADAPVRLQAEQMVWELGSRSEGSDAWRLVDDGARIGASIQLPWGRPSRVRVTIRARAVPAGLQAAWPDMLLYWNGSRFPAGRSPPRGMPSTGTISPPREGCSPWKSPLRTTKAEPSTWISSWTRWT